MVNICQGRQKQMDIGGGGLATVETYCPPPPRFRRRCLLNSEMPRERESTSADADAVLSIFRTS